MKKSIIIILTFAFSLGMFAQSASMQKTAKSVFTLTTFNKDGSLRASSHGVFVSSDGQAISTWAPFAGADHAIVIDANGRQHNVETIIGANELYDVCKFTVSETTLPAPIASSQANGKAYLIGYSVAKADVKPFKIGSVEKFMNKYNYYIFTQDAAENMASCPFVNDRAQVIGLLQHGKNGEVYATDAQLANDIKANAFSVNDPVLRTCAIRTALPEKQEEALLTMMMTGETVDSLKRQAYIDDFIKRFPTATEGYTNKAISYVDAGKYAEADKMMQTAIERATKKDEAHSEYAKVILQKQIYHADSPYPAWTLDKALEEARKAEALNPLDVYRHQQAQIIYSQGQYQQAYDRFMALTQSPIRNGEFFYEAAQCKTMLKAPQTEIMALLDSAVAACPQPLTSVAAPYVLARGMALDAQENYRLALKDYNLYDSLMQGRPLASNFYYMRYKCETKTRQYLQALNDIARAIIMTPDEPTYYAEMASLSLRVKRLKDAEKAAQRCTELAPEYADGHLLLGISQLELGKKETARLSLLKAKELGDKRADEYLKRIK